MVVVLGYVGRPITVVDETDQPVEGVVIGLLLLLEVAAQRLAHMRRLRSTSSRGQPFERAIGALFEIELLPLHTSEYTSPIAPAQSAARLASASAADELLHALMGYAEELSCVPEADANVVDEGTSCTSGRRAGLGSLLLGPPSARATRANSGLHLCR